MTYFVGQCLKHSWNWKTKTCSRNIMKTIEWWNAPTLTMKLTYIWKIVETWLTTTISPFFGVGPFPTRKSCILQTDWNWNQITKSRVVQVDTWFTLKFSKWPCTGVRNLFRYSQDIASWSCHNPSPLAPALLIKRKTIIINKSSPQNW